MMIRKPTIHRMDRRSAYKNYMLPGIYHITVKATDTLRSPFGKVVGNVDKPDGDADAPRKYHYRRKDEGISVVECKTMNCVAQALCRKSDDWWKWDEQKNNI